MNAFQKILSIVLLAVSPKQDNQRHFESLEYDKKQFAYVTVLKPRGNEWDEICLSVRAKRNDGLWHNAPTPQW